MTDPLTLPESERDRLAAIHVMEWTLVDGRYYSNGVIERGEQYWFCQDGPCDDDYLILHKVRKTWSADDAMKFSNTLNNFWGKRLNGDGEFILNMLTKYEPGDYRDASLLVLAEKGEI